MRICKRLLDIDLQAGRSAFLWGPRKVGKTHWLRHHAAAPAANFIDLLETDTFADYVSRPALLRERWRPGLTIIDEVQKVPALLDEVHWLIERKKATFLLTGSSARKLRRGHANLLGGRAWRFEMGPLSAHEVEDFDLDAALASGLLPPHLLSPEPARDLRAYVADYLREEIAAEAVVRNVPAFTEFLRTAALTSSELLNYENVARETGISAKVVRGYFEILEDTLLGERLPPWRRAATRRMVQTEKFFLFDVGVASHLARRSVEPGSAGYGKAFEHWVLMELQSYRRYRSPDLPLAFWRTSSGLEVDFIVGDMDLAIEAKSGRRVHAGDLRGLAALRSSHAVRKAVVVCGEPEARIVDGVEILPWRMFVDRLWAGDLVA
jgi:predicted AAA+ superfamily ATPase